MGFLNPSYDDNYRIQSMPGTTDIPAAGALEGSLSAIPKGIAASAAKLTDLALDASETKAGSYLLHNVPFGGLAMDSFTPERRAQTAAAAKVVGEWGATGQDPRVTGSVGRIASGTTEGLTIGATGALVGPWGAAALLGATEGHATYKGALAQGLDQGAAEDMATVTALFSAAGALVPMKFGSTAIGSLIGGGATNLAIGAAQRGLTSAALEAHGHHDMAQQYRIFDGEAMAADGILGTAFGTMGHFVHPEGSAGANPADVDAALAVSAEDHFNRSALGVPVDPVTATLHADTMATALRSMHDGGLPDVPPERAQQLVDNVVPDPIHEVADPIHEAALEDLPGYADMAHEVPRVELPPEQPAPPAWSHMWPDLVASAERDFPHGPKEAAEPVKLDDFNDAALGRLVHEYGDQLYGYRSFEGSSHESGEVPMTFRDMAVQMQRERDQAESFGRLFGVAAACASQNFGA